MLTYAFTYMEKITHFFYSQMGKRKKRLPDILSEYWWSTSPVFPVSVCFLFLYNDIFGCQFWVYVQVVTSLVLVNFSLSSLCLLKVLNDQTSVVQTEVKQEEPSAISGKIMSPAGRVHGKDLRGSPFISKPVVVLFKVPHHWWDLVREVLMKWNYALSSSKAKTMK